MSAIRNYIKKEVQEYLLDMWWLAIRKSHEQANKDILLDYDEAIAVYAYTNNYPPFYDKINDALRTGEDHYLVELIDSALSKLPVDESSVVHRWCTISTSEINILISGDSIINAGYTSTNLHAKRYDGSSFDCDSIRIFSLIGRNISLYSYDNSIGLEEILIPRNSRFTLLFQNVVPGFSYDLMQLPAD
nr:hypothetical protein E5140_18485 [Pantoea agglomerans]